MPTKLTISVKVVPQSRKQTLTKISKTSPTKATCSDTVTHHYTAHLKSPAKQGRANRELITLLFKHFANALDIKIIKGHTKRTKLVMLTLQ